MVVYSLARSRAIKYFCVGLLAAIIAACSTPPENEEYKASKSLAPLIVPADLSAPVESDAMAIPDAGTGLKQHDSSLSELPLSELLVPPVFVPDVETSEEEVSKEASPEGAKKESPEESTEEPVP